MVSSGKCGEMCVTHTTIGTTSDRSHGWARAGWKQRLAAGVVMAILAKVVASSPGASSRRLAFRTALRSATGVSKPQRSTLRPKQGRITESLVNDGDVVEAGQVLARMDTQTLEAELRQAHAQVRQAQQATATATAIVAQRESAKATAAAIVAQRECKDRCHRRCSPTPERTGLGRQGISPFTAAGPQRRRLSTAARY